MAPINSPNGFGSVAGILKETLTSLATFFPFFLPALFGAVAGTLQSKEGSNMRTFILTIVMSWVCGFGMTPLFAHLFGLPDGVSQSLSFFLGFWGIKGMDLIWTLFKKKVDKSQ